MMISKIREGIRKNIGKEFIFVVNGSRNQRVEFNGIIVNCYDYVFTVRNMSNNIIKSFSYTDLLIGYLEILQ